MADSLGRSPWAFGDSDVGQKSPISSIGIGGLTVSSRPSKSLLTAFPYSSLTGLEAVLAATRFVPRQ
jgi:hypothetical protein